MKKLVVILLIVLPFILIYFISITGRVLETYSHIYVESITVKDEDNNEIGLQAMGPNQQGSGNVEVDKGTTKKLYIEVGPELASNKELKIETTNKEICEYVLKNNILEITGLKFGVAKLTLTSIDYTRIKYTLNVKVTDSIPTGLVFEKEEVVLFNKNALQLPQPKFEPATAKPEYKQLIWESSDETIVKIENSEVGLVKALKEGEVIITAKSTFDPNLSATIKVIVKFDKSELDVHFTDNGKYQINNGIYIIKDSELDLKTITDFSDKFKNEYSEEVRFEKFIYKVSSNNKYLDESRLSEGILKFNEISNGKLFKIRIYLVGEDSPIDEITIQYKNN